ncbi:hypothetical protein BDM02DRAFT_3190261 [Thelephora ganbajun]|uniref:Uncharacterized protein n=1 Tax=Thelephora ganbajun TaxID=370292 RepID=A0ACB6Z572_THEGA|nr:hypothetical protein BDM02DRAFT_3190261 [Thelephora ganbajun]
MAVEAEGIKHKRTRLRLLVTLLGDRGLVGLRNPNVTSVDRVITYSSAQAGGGDADTANQVGLPHHKYWSKLTVQAAAPHPYWHSWAFGVVFMEKHIVQPLVPLLWLGEFTRVGHSTGRLQGHPRCCHYGNLGVRRGSPHLDLKLVSETQFFPYITSFADKSIKDGAHFSYEGHTDSDPNGNKAAHCLLTTRGLTPPLSPCNQSIPSDFAMVVMDHVNGKHLFHKYPYVTPDKALNKVSN